MKKQLFLAMAVFMLLFSSCAQSNTRQEAQKSLSSALAESSKESVKPSPRVSDTTAPVETVFEPLPSLEWYDYYIVNKNMRKGVVNKFGQVVLPFEFAEVQLAAKDPVIFIASSGTARINGKQLETNGGLFDSQGKPILRGDFLYAYEKCNGYICVANSDYMVGLISFDGKEVIPCQYNRLTFTGNGFEAVIKSADNSVPVVDIYDMNGSFIKSENRETSRNYYYSNGEYSFYLQEKDAFYGVTDINGKVIVPFEYRNIVYEIDENTGEIIFSASEGWQYKSAIYDYEGNIIYQSSEYEHAYKQGEYIFVRDTYDDYKVQITDKILNKLIPHSSTINWYPDSKVFVCINTNNSGSPSAECYTLEGKKLPFPECYDIIPLSTDRFIVQGFVSIHFKSGLYNSSGSMLLPMEYSFNITSEPSKLTYKTDNNSGIMDINGNILIDGFDYIYPIEGQELLSARSGVRSGLVDTNGDWIWSTSVYDTLMD